MKKIVEIQLKDLENTIVEEEDNEEIVIIYQQKEQETKRDGIQKEKNDSASKKIKVRKYPSLQNISVSGDISECTK